MARFKPMELIDKMSGKNQEPGSLLQKKKRPSSAFFAYMHFFSYLCRLFYQIGLKGRK